MTRGIENGDLIEAYANKVKELERHLDTVDGSLLMALIVIAVLATILIVTAVSLKSLKTQEEFFYADVDIPTRVNLTACVLLARPAAGKVVQTTVSCFQNLVKTKYKNTPW